MFLIHSKELYPQSVSQSCFLAGPTYRNASDGISWRKEAYSILKELGYDGHVFTPEYRDGTDVDLHSDESYLEQVEWENQGLNQADVIVFWVPRDMKTLPALTTNVEFGMWVRSGKIVFGWPFDCPAANKNRYLKELAIKYNVPIANTLKETLQLALDKIGPGQLREGGETKVPLYVYQSPVFKKWLQAQKAVGNELRDAKVLWTFFPGKSKNLFCYVVHLHVWIKDEQRIKSNEFSFFRSDISSIVLFYPEKEIKTVADLVDAKILLVREYRVPARTADGKITELPGGSSKKDKPAEVVAVEELHEETSFEIDPDRLIKIDERQLAGTLSAHISSVFAAIITKEEYEYLSGVAKSGKTFGVIEDTEMTYVEVMSIREILQSKIVDWSTIGMIFESVWKVSSSWPNQYMVSKSAKYLFVDRKSPSILESIASAPIFKKHGEVRAYRSTGEAVIETVMANGLKETVSTTKVGDWIVINPTGEKYIISEEKFLSRYDPTSKEHVYSAKGYCKAIKNPFGKDIEIMASWGSPQFGDENCWIAETCDSSGKMEGEPYLIEANAFEKTYKEITLS